MTRMATDSYLGIIIQSVDSVFYLAMVMRMMMRMMMMLVQSDLVHPVCFRSFIPLNYDDGRHSVRRVPNC